MPPTAAVRITVEQPAAIPVRSGWTTSLQLDALVGVAAAGEDQHHLVADRDGPALGVMARRRVAGKEGQGGQRDRGSRGAQALRRRGQAGAEDDQDVVMLHAGAPGQLPGRPGRVVRGLGHGGKVGVTSPAACVS